MRRKGKSLILLALVFLLTTITSGALSIREAIINTDLNLRRQLPAITTVYLDHLALNHAQTQRGWIKVDHIKAPMIREIGALPYVRLFDYTAWGYHFFSHELVRAFHPELFLELDGIEVAPDDTGSLSFHGNVDLEQFRLKGSQAPGVADIEAGLIDLVHGRTFIEAEMNSLSYVAIVSQNFLEANRLSLGDTFILDYNIYHEQEKEMIVEEHYSVDNLILSTPFELKIIGVFEHTLPENFELSDIRQHMELINRIYVPNLLIESTLDLYIEAFLETQPELLEEILVAESLEDILLYENIMFLLYDPTYLAAFNTAASAIIPDFWVVGDLSNAYADIANSMEMMNWIANLLAFGSTLATLIVLTLLVVLFLRDRKPEIGIYLALGAKKVSVIWQMLIEVIAVSLVAITLALFVGHLLAASISTTIIRNDLTRQASLEEDVITASGLERMGFRHEMTHEEMLASYDVTLNLMTIVIFYSIALCSILLATAIPIIYITRLNPKRILM